ncbi:hypothetical protein [Demequina iriomotensis]|uniref:hypothetical protein n=1 Tax=Demequina iriomotensis TaxID=1536641 RepID=UPI000781DD9E|nr:hypothetical protein [Demequina iriomotensis]
MSAPLVRALGAEDDAGAQESLGGLATRAAARVRSRRRRRLGASAAGGIGVLAVAALAVSAARVPGTDTPAPAAPSPSATEAQYIPSTHAGPLSAASLIASATPRHAGESGDRQEALVCDASQATGALVDCAAVWVGDRRLVGIDPMSQVTAFVGAERARLDFDVTFAATGGVPVQITWGSGLTALLSDPDAPQGEGAAHDFLQYDGTSLWVEGSRRTALLEPSEDPGMTVEPGTSLGTGFTFAAEAPAPGAEASPTWAIAHGAASGAITFQMRVPGASEDGFSVLLLEVTMPIATPRPGLTADALATGFVPRARSEAPRDDAQAALLCTIPRRVLHGSAWSAVVACDAGWVDGALVSGAGAGAVGEGTYGPTFEWAVDAVADRPILADHPRLLIEGDVGAQAAPRDTLALTGYDDLVTEGTAWLPDGRRAAVVFGYDGGYPLGPGTQGGYSELTPGPLWASHPIDLDALATSIGGTGAATARVSMPFVDDPSRVLILEAPLD